MTGDYTKVPLRPRRALDRRAHAAGARPARSRLEPQSRCCRAGGARAGRGRDRARRRGGRAATPSRSASPRAAPRAHRRGRADVGRRPHGLCAPATFGYADQDQIEPLPATGTALVYLDVFEEHVQPAEDAGRVGRPGASTRSTARRGRASATASACASTSADTCEEALDGLALAAGSTGTLSISRVAPAAPADPCAPPGDPLGQLPDGLFRVEVLDPGGPGDARFAWSFENGAAAVAVTEVAGRPGHARALGVRQVRGRRARRGLLAGAARGPRRPRRALHDRRVARDSGGRRHPHSRSTGDGAGRRGRARRPALGRRDGGDSERRLGHHCGETTWASASRPARATTWSATAWGARVREEKGVGIEQRTDAPPDGVRHAFAPLALVDLDARTVLHDCRPTFVPLTATKPHCGSCTVSAAPGDDLQAAVDSLPAEGGELCLAAGALRAARAGHARRAPACRGLGRRPRHRPARHAERRPR